jgi:NitT/TauT family transport system substrate-binding protein
MTRRNSWILAAVVAGATAAWLWLAQKNPVLPASPPEKLTIAALALPGAGLFFVAQEKGFFREKGLDVDLQKHTVGKLALDALFGGGAAFAIAGDTPLVFSILGGSRPDILATVYRPNGGISITALKDRVTNPGDLRGKRLGVTFISSGQFVADTFLLVNGITQADVSLLDMKQSDMVEALVAGKIDAACLWQPYLADAQTKLGDRGITFPNNGLYTFRLSLVANHGYADQNRDQVRKVLAALKQAQVFTVENPADALRIMSKATAITEATFKTFFDPADYAIGLEQGLLITLEDQTRWAIKHNFVKTEKMPNFLEYVKSEGLGAVSPESARITR